MSNLWKRGRTVDIWGMLGLCWCGSMKSLSKQISTVVPGFCYCMRCGIEHGRKDCDYMPFDTLNATWNPKTGELRGAYNLAPIKREGKPIDYRGLHE